MGRGSFAESTRIAEVLRKETVGGALLLLATLIALVWVNSPAAGSSEALRDYTVGPELLHLHLSLRTWAADGSLAIFFLVDSWELKRELVAGDIAFALAVLAIISTHLPTGPRTFLLTLAVVDDLVAVTIIGLFSTSGLACFPSPEP